MSSNLILQLTPIADTRNGHHIFGPSSLYRRAKCPASARMEAMAPEEPESEDAERGRAMHNAVYDDVALAALEPGDQTMVERARELLGDFDVQEWIYEQRLEIHHDGQLAKVLLSFGTADAYGILANDPTTAVLIDFKFGGYPPEPEESHYQLGPYAVGIMQRHPEVKKVIAFIYAPLGKSWKESPAYEFTKPEEILFHIRAIRTSCQNSPTTFQVGSWCNYCSARSQCSALSMVQDGTIQKADQANAVTSQNAGILWDLSRVIESRCKDIRARIRELALKADIPGFEWQTRAGNREISDVQVLWQVMSEAGVAQEEFIALTTVPVGKAEKLFADKCKAAGLVKTKADGTRLFNEKAPIGRKAEKRELVRIADERMAS